MPSRYKVSGPTIDSETGGWNFDGISSDGTGNGNLTIAGTVAVTGAQTLTGATALNGAATLAGVTLVSRKKLGFAADADFIDFSAAQGLLKLGPTSTTLKLSGLAATTSNLTDNNANEIVAVARSTFSTITATNHNYAGATPNTVLFDQTSGTATATAIGSIGASQYTPTGGVSANYTAIAMLA